MKDSELSELIHDLEDGVIEEVERQRLMQQLRSRPAARELYMQQMRLAALLHQTAETRGELGTIPVSQEMLSRARRQSAWTAVAWGVAAVFLIALGLMFFQVQLKFKTATPKIAINSSQDARYQIEVADREVSGGENQMMPGDRILIERGLLQLKFPSKVEALIEGPAEVELISASELRLDRGISWFRVPKKAKGFAVRTDQARVVDLGTEFGMWFDGEGDLQVHVGKGRVRVEPRFKESASFEVSGGEAIRLNELGVSEEIGMEESLFRREFSSQVPYLHWSFDYEFDGVFPADGSLTKDQRYFAEIRYLGGQQLTLNRKMGALFDLL